MGVQGIVQNGVVVPDDPKALAEGTRVIILPAPDEKAPTFGEWFASIKGAGVDLPEDFAEQHDHYRLGTPKR